MSRPIFSFSGFTFDATTGVLTYKNRESRLPEQTARLLQLLLERSNSLVSREEIERALWPDENFVSHSQGINVAINRLRQILRDDPKQPQFLRTIPKRGYSFCGEVRVNAEQVPPAAKPPASFEIAPSMAQVPEQPAAELARVGWEQAPAPKPAGLTVDLAPAAASPRPARLRRLLWFCAATSLLLAGVLAARWPWKPGTGPPVLRVGIAPLRAGEDQQDRDAAESLRLQLSDAMARLPGVQVPAAAAFAPPDATDIPRTAQRLRLDDLLLGSLSKQGDQYDVRFELVRATDATHIVSFEYSGARKDFPAICDHLQQDIFHHMRLQSISLQGSKGSTNNPQAYEAYLQGNYSMLERRPESLQRSLSEFKRATTLDPEFAAAYAGMAAAYLRLSEYDTDPRNGLLESSQQSARRALKLDPMLAQAHAVLGTAAYKRDRQFVQGEAELREAIRIDPNEATYRNWLSVLLVEEGRFDEALEQLDLARERAPFWPSVYAMEGLANMYARRDAAAIKAARHYVDLLPSLPIAHNTMAWIYFDTRHYEEAIGEWRQMALLQNDGERARLEEHGLEVLRTRGIHAYAELRLAAMGSSAARQVNDFNAAEWYACAGRRDQALDQLDRFGRANDPFLLHVGVDPIFDTLHQDPRFLKILARSGITVPSSLRGVQSGICQ